jgi:enoyl-CoA hydratase
MKTALTYKNILTSVKDEILTITVNRPDKLNALTKDTIQEIGSAISEAANDSAIAGIIITGAGPKAFVAGADISEFTSLSVEEGKKMSKAGQDVFRAIELCKKPVIAAVNGFALGGGCELAMSCHMRVASDNAKFGQPEVNLGLIPGYGGTQRMVQLIGKGKAAELMMTADMIDANTALQLGLVNYVATPDHLIATCEELLNKIKTKSPKAIAAIIRSVDANFNGDDGYKTEVDEFGKLFGTEDFKEGVGAFLEKRKANFKR